MGFESPRGAMLVRIIYRPSRPLARVTHNAVGAGRSSFEPADSLSESDPVTKARWRLKRVALRPLAHFLFRLALVALFLAAWRIAADLGLPLRFLFTSGVLSHWQVWFSAAILLAGSAGLVARRLQFSKARDDGDGVGAQAA
jgi:hypothetical protein